MSACGHTPPALYLFSTPTRFRLSTWDGIDVLASLHNKAHDKCQLFALHYDPSVGVPFFSAHSLPSNKGYVSVPSPNFQAILRYRG
jgi:hypothetical protein